MVRFIHRFPTQANGAAAKSLDTQLAPATFGPSENGPWKFSFAFTNGPVVQARPKLKNMEASDYSDFLRSHISDRSRTIKIVEGEGNAPNWRYGDRTTLSDNHLIVGTHSEISRLTIKLNQGFAQTTFFSKASQHPLEVDWASHIQTSIPPAHMTCDDDVQHNAIVKGFLSYVAIGKQ
ncbi:hypothetical protein Tco_0946088 [Tanacetum coccineum]